jgi:hypothetical protein
MPVKNRSDCAGAERPKIIGNAGMSRRGAEGVATTTTDAAEKGFEENDPEGVAFEYEVLE